MSGHADEGAADMTYRRALALAPLAVLVGVLGHAGGFAADHGLGGAHAGELLAVGIGAAALLALFGLVWVAVDSRSQPHAEAALWGALAPHGYGVAVGKLGLFGLAVFASGELLEGRWPLGTWSSGLALAASAVVVAWVARTVVRWIARGGVAIRAALRRSAATAPRPAPVSFAATPLARPLPGRSPSRGRAPPLFA